MEICKDEYFKQRGIPNMKNVNLYLCPKMDTVNKRKQAILRNGYLDIEDRDSFAINIVKCSQEFGLVDQCESDDNIKELMSHIVVNVFTITQKIHFRSLDNLMKNPTMHNVDFFQQFILDYDSYRDNNNFIKINKVEQRDRRYLNVLQE